MPTIWSQAGGNRSIHWGIGAGVACQQSEQYAPRGQPRGQEHLQRRIRERGARDAKRGKPLLDLAAEKA